jgi:tungstate transport system ATP-binding protein
MAAVRRVQTPGTRGRGDVLLEVHELVVMRAQRRILEVDELQIRSGETLTVVGPNGAGKSTLLLALARLVRPDRGVILFAGVPLGGHDELAHRRRIGLVLPAPLLLSTSVFDNVAAGLRFRRVGAAETRERVEEWLERLSITHLRDRPAVQLSTGEAQRVSLARAFVLDPELLLLDEPFASLDPGTRAELTDDFDRLRRGTATTCVLVTHDLNEAARLGDRMAVLLDGSIRQCDAPGRVMAAPADEDVAAFLGTPTGVRGRVVAARDGLVVVDVGARSEPDLPARADALLRVAAGRPDMSAAAAGAVVQSVAATGAAAASFAEAQALAAAAATEHDGAAADARPGADDGTAADDGNASNGGDAADGPGGS